MDQPQLSPQNGHPYRIFVVDDEAVIATTLALILRREGFTARSFTHAHTALESAKIDPPDLLISDVVMPEVSGIELAIQIRREQPACKILLFSGQAATADLLQDARCRGYEFVLVQKPVHPTDLIRLIGQLAA